MLGCSSKPLSHTPRPTHPLETVCVSLLDLVVALAKFLSSLLERDNCPSLLSFTTALAESFPSMSIHNVFSWPISTFFHFSWVGKPILETLAHNKIEIE